MTTKELKEAHLRVYCAAMTGLLSYNGNGDYQYDPVEAAKLARDYAERGVEVIEELFDSIDDNRT